MGKRYYCEYCKRAFQDNLTARKKHLNSLTHLRNRQQWYNNFKDKKQILQEHLAKKPCNKFLSTGNCPFDDRCKYRHIKQADIARLQAEVENSSIPPKLPPTEDIVRKWLSNHENTSTKKAQELEEKVTNEDVTSQPLLPVYDVNKSLPPSLLPPPTGRWEYTCKDFVEWG